MQHVYTEFEIPTGEPYPEDECGLGPSAELMPFTPEPLRAAEVVGRRVDDMTTSAGYQGMGGPGFFGLQLGEEWLIIAVWGAADWLQAEGRRIMDTHYETNGSPRPWISHGADELTPRVIGRTITAIEVARTTMAIRFDDGLTLSIEDDPASRPRLQGTGEPRAFATDEDLRAAVFLSPTTEIWV